jgi:hypothetical protein
MPPLRAIVAALALVLSGGASLVGCGSEQGYHGFNFKNQTNVQVTIVRPLSDGAEIVVVTAIDAGNSYSALGFPGLTSTGDACQEMTLVARDPEHAEVSRLSGRLCRDGEWIIRGPTPTGVTRETGAP